LPAESAGRSQPIGRPAGQIGPADTIHQILGFLRIQMNFRTIPDLIYRLLHFIRPRRFLNPNF